MRKVGDKIKSTGGCWSTFFNGEISKVNSDGTYDIKFDDGDKKSGVSSHHIISTGFSVGQAVTWNIGDCDVPKGTVGVIFKMHEDGERATVRFLKGEWSLRILKLINLKNSSEKVPLTFTSQREKIYVGNGKYFGQFNDANQRHGLGRYTFVDGRKYDGEWKDNTKHGQGTFTWADGNKYNGQWKDDKMNGRGVYTYANGVTYDGEFRDNEKNGHGTYTYTSGSKYVGEFKHGKMSGRGKLTSYNGDSWTGTYVNGKACGMGIDQSGKQVRKGGK